jgi:hypothetical protein
MALWTPAEITTALWLDAADSSTLFDAVSGGSLVAADGAIARWEDKSGNGRHATQSTVGARPIRKASIQNGLDVARGDGSRRMSIASSAAMFNAFHSAEAFLACVIRAGDISNPNALYGILGNAGTPTALRTGFACLWDDRASVPANNRLGCVFLRNNSEVVAREADNFLPNTFGVLDSLYDVQNATLANKTTLSINGGSVVNSASGTFSATAQTNASQDLFVFDYGINAFMVGDIAEMLLFNSPPAIDDRLRVIGYLAWKWGTQGSLPNDHPYKNAAPRTGALVTIIRQHYAAQGAR